MTGGPKETVRLVDWLSRPIEDRRRLAVELRTRAEADAHSSGAWVRLVDGDALAAELAEDRGPMAAVPIAVKDNIDVADVPTTGGTPALVGSVPFADAGAVGAVRTLGAPLLGKSNLHELAFGITSNNALHGPVRNPVDPRRSAGGSSGGSAAIVARGEAPLSFGTDTGGSISIPASFCGVAGLRPTTGRYPGDGVVHLTWSLDTVGLHAATAEDLLIADRAVIGDVPELLAPLTAAPAAGDLVLAVPESYLQDLAAPVAARFQDALGALEGAGVRVVPLVLDDLLDVTKQWQNVLVGWEAPRALDAYLRELADPYSALTTRELAGSAASPDVAALLGLLQDRSVPAAAYREALAARSALRRAYTRALSEAGADALLFPTAPVLPTELGEDDTIEHHGRTVPVFETVARHTAPGTFMGAPMVTVPTPGDGLPIGVCLQGRFFDDRRLLAAADRVERVLWSRAPAALSRARR